MINGNYLRFRPCNGMSGRANVAARLSAGLAPGEVAERLRLLADIIDTKDDAVVAAEIGEVMTRQKEMKWTKTQRDILYEC